MELDETKASDARGLTHGSDAEAYCSVCEGSFAPGTELCPNDGTRLVQFQDKSDHLIGKVLDGRFEIIERIGQGGMGNVYRAKQSSVGREVAIKVVKPSLSADRVAAKRFLREAKLLSRVSQSNVVVVHDTGQAQDGSLYLAMELVEGRTLSQVLEEEGPLPGPRVLGIALQICDALEAAHKQGIIHRDLKPSNIIVNTRSGGRDQVKVLDFGLAKSLAGDETSSTITNTGAVMGTPLYMSPEMITGDVVDGRTDLYSLGCVLYEMCTGYPPFVADTASLLLSKHISESAQRIARPDLGQLPALIDELLQKKADRRPKGATELAEKLSLALKDTWNRPSTAHELAARAATAPAPANAFAETLHSDETAHLAPAATPQPSTSRRGLLAGLALVALVAGGAAAFILGQGRDTGNDAADEKQEETKAPPSELAAAPNEGVEGTPDEATTAPALALDASMEAPPADAQPAEVLLRVDSTPRATVWLNGDKLGSTPLETPLPRSDEEQTLELRHKGYELWTKALVASEDLSFDATLTRKKRKSGGKKDPTRTPDKKPPADDKPSVRFLND